MNAALAMAPAASSLEPDAFFGLDGVAPLSASQFGCRRRGFGALCSHALAAAVLRLPMDAGAAQWWRAAVAGDRASAAATAASGVANGIRAGTRYLQAKGVPSRFRVKGQGFTSRVG